MATKLATLKRIRAITESFRKKTANLRDDMRSQLEDLQALVDSVEEGESSLQSAVDCFDDAILSLSEQA